MDAERARERNERTEEARLLTASNLEAARIAEERAQRQAAWRSEAQWKVHCDKVRAEGEARRAQGQRAIAWGGTEEAEAQRKHQEERAKRTATARTKSSAHVARARYEELLSTQKRDEEETRERRRWEQEMVDRHARNKSEGEEALRLAQEEKARIDEQNEKCVKILVLIFSFASHIYDYCTCSHPPVPQKHSLVHVVTKSSLTHVHAIYFNTDIVELATRSTKQRPCRPRRCARG